MRTVRNLFVSLILFGVAGAVFAATTPIHESTFDSEAGTSPVTAGDVTSVWAIDGQWHDGALGYFDYNGAGQLLLHHPDHHYDHPYLNYDTSQTLAVNHDMEAVIDVNPQFTATGTEQGIIFGLAPGSAFADDGKQDAVFMVKSTRGVVGITFTGSAVFNNDATKYIPLDVNAAQLTALRLIVTYNAASQEFRGFYSVNGGPLKEGSSKPIKKARTTPVVKLATGQRYTWYDLSMEFYDVLVDDLKIYDAIQTTGPAEICPVRASGFNYPAEGTSDVYYAKNVGDVDDVYKASATTYAYNGAGAFAVTQPASGANSNLKIKTVTTASQDVQVDYDILPRFAANGVAQAFNIKFGSNKDSIFIMNFGGTGNGVLMYFAQDDIFALLPTDAVSLGNPADLHKLHVTLTYNATAHQLRLFYSINGGAFLEHVRSPLSDTRTAIETEFQWQIWGNQNPTDATFGVDLDHYAEYDQILRTQGTPNAARANWTLY